MIIQKSVLLFVLFSTLHAKADQPQTCRAYDAQKDSSFSRDYKFLMADLCSKQEDKERALHHKGTADQLGMNYQAWANAGGLDNTNLSIAKERKAHEDQIKKNQDEYQAKVDARQAIIAQQKRDYQATLARQAAERRAALKAYCDQYPNGEGCPVDSSSDAASGQR